MDKRQLKKLAYDYYYNDKRLTVEERNILLNSKYSTILDGKKRAFDAVFENAVPMPGEEVMVQKPKRMVKFIDKPYPHVQRLRLVDLIDGIHNRFNLDIDNTSPSKYRDVNLDELKNHICSHCEHELMDDETRNYINQALVHDNIYNLLHDLYYGCSGSWD